VDKTPRRPQNAPVAIGRALRQLRGQTTQVQLAKALGTTQASVSRWESDKDPSVPSFDEMHAIERHLKAPRGALLVAAGLVEVDGVEAALLADPDLEPGERDLVLDVYRLGIQRSAERRKPRK
jgi:transcriptional regulator with XRE-family HTH domain